jgi:hypothetical protein
MALACPTHHNQTQGKGMNRTTALVVCLLVSAPLNAQESGTTLDRIEVTGSRISYDDLLDTPAVSITRSGDYLLQEIKLVNDTRDRAAREREIHDTIARLLASGSRYALLHDDAYRIELARENHKVPVIDDSKRPDTGEVTLQLKAGLGSNPARAEAIVREMQAFIRNTDGVGRTEVNAIGETALGMSKPERYRYDLIAAISEDTGRVTQALGMQCDVELSGLNSRIEWQRVSSGELLLYIPYSMKISGCSQSVQTARR